MDNDIIKMKRYKNNQMLLYLISVSLRPQLVCMGSKTKWDCGWIMSLTSHKSFQLSIMSVDLSDCEWRTLLSEPRC